MPTADAVQSTKTSRLLYGGPTCCSSPTRCPTRGLYVLLSDWLYLASKGTSSLIACK